MEYKRFNNTIYLRVDKGEEVLSQLKNVCKAENITLAYVSAIGATGDFTVGVFKTDEKKYYANSFKGDYEIVSLTGTVTTKDGAFYAHLHMSAGGADGKVFGGHLNRAVISATCEMVIFITDGTVDRQFSEEVGLNLFKFN
ncbi:MAG: DNA-binding protein [Clostridia bacterium]|nr:DNA-binding protein [Clostridia bacterium]